MNNSGSIDESMLLEEMQKSFEDLTNVRKNLHSSMEKDDSVINNLHNIPGHLNILSKKIKVTSLPEEDKQILLTTVYEISNVVNNIMSEAYSNADFTKTAFGITENCVMRKPDFRDRILKLEKEKNTKDKENGEIMRELTHDGLTGLKSSFYFNGVGKELFYRSDNFSLTFIDLDNFKKINDSRGHDYGDILFRIFGIYLFEYFDSRTNGISIRKHGDEFLILSENRRICDFITKMKNDINNGKCLPELDKIEKFIRGLNCTDSNINFNITSDEKYNKLVESIFNYYKNDYVKNKKLSIEKFSFVELLKLISFSYGIVFKEDMNIKDFDLITKLADDKMYKNKATNKEQIKKAS